MSSDGATCFALLDDRDATAEQPASRRYTGFVRAHRCVDPARLDTVWAEVDADLRRGLHAVLLCDYEWGAKLLHAGDAGLAADDGAALTVLMFERLERLSADEVAVWLDGLEPAAPPSGVMDLQPTVDRAAFTAAIAAIHEAIAAGETYQVNYTYRLNGAAYGSPVALYRQLRRHQPVSYGALIALPPGAAVSHVLSCSPELFLRHEGGTLTARPMKGTASRFRGAEGDSETARHLSIDIKNRAENLMIVDLLRNDLGRLAQIGSVQVPSLFAIEPYTTVFQMTSTVQARLRPEVGFAEILRAAFPCGSITGAPKHHTMELIAGLETTPRGLYCGAIGWVDAPAADARCGDFCLSVAIRTLTLGAETGGLRPARLGIGAGIVMDSRADDEFDECLLKARFLTGLDPGFELFETMLAAAPAAASGAGAAAASAPAGRRASTATIEAERSGAAMPAPVPPSDARGAPTLQLRLLDRHLDRLARSAAQLGFRFDRDAVAAAITERVATLLPAQTWRLRLALGHGGAWRLEHAVLAPLPDAPVTLLVAATLLPACNPLAAHKTTSRAVYDAGVRTAEQAGAFDSLFFNMAGRLVEGGRSSVFVRLAGRWFTPPLADGALPGVMRAQLLDDPAWAASERSLTRPDLQRADAVVVCNALRGVLPARLRCQLPAHAAA